MKPVFLTFGDNNFHLRKFKLVNEAMLSAWFSKFIVFDKFFLQDNLEINKRINDSSRSRGYGYWIWKSYIIHRVLNTIEENEILVYLDAGCSLNLNGTQEFFNLINLLKNQNEKDIISFSLGFAEKHFTKRDLFKHLNCDEIEITDSGQIISGMHIWKNTKFTRDLSNEWYDISLIDNLIDDSSSKELNYENFVEHRHDQSIFSLLIKKNKEKCFILDDNSYHVNFNSLEAKQSTFPFFATRLRD
jgi:hypothetical protein